MAKKEKLLEALYDKVTNTSEEDFLRYLVDCCENVLENEKIMDDVLVNQGIGYPPVMQLVKLRAELSQRLEAKYGTMYGKFANKDSLLVKLAKVKL